MIYRSAHNVILAIISIRLILNATKMYKVAKCILVDLTASNAQHKCMCSTTEDVLQ